MRPFSIRLKHRQGWGRAAGMGEYPGFFRFGFTPPALKMDGTQARPDGPSGPWSARMHGNTHTRWRRTVGEVVR